MTTELFDQENGLEPTTSTKMGGLSFPEYAQIIAGAKELPESDVDAAMVAANIMAAGSLEEGLGNSKAEGLRSHVGEEIIIHDARLNRSDEQYRGQGSAVYAAIECTLAETGERVVLTTGAFSVLGALGLIHKLGRWDESFEVKEVPTPNGKALKLVYLPPVEPFADEA